MDYVSQLQFVRKQDINLGIPPPRATQPQKWKLDRPAAGDQGSRGAGWGADSEQKRDGGMLGPTQACLQTGNHLRLQLPCRVQFGSLGREAGAVSEAPSTSNVVPASKRGRVGHPRPRTGPSFLPPLLHMFGAGAGTKDITPHCTHDTPLDSNSCLTLQHRPL